MTAAEQYARYAAFAARQHAEMQARYAAAAAAAAPEAEDE